MEAFGRISAFLELPPSFLSTSREEEEEAAAAAPETFPPAARRAVKGVRALAGARLRVELVGGASSTSPCLSGSTVGLWLNL